MTSMMNGFYRGKSNEGGVGVDKESAGNDSMYRRANGPRREEETASKEDAIFS
jgi:hypothetical protein